MDHPSLVFVIFVIFSGAAVLATVALYTRQALLVAYIALGILVGPWGLAWVPDTELIQQIADIGIIFLLFLLGLDLQPQDLIHSLRNTLRITFASSLIFALFGFGIGLLLDFTLTESLILGAALTFSSTILGIKLLPTTVLHHQRMGEIIIAVLLLQDFIAIAVLLIIQGTAKGGNDTMSWLAIAAAIPVLAGTAFAFGTFVLNRLLIRFDTIREYIFLLAIGWCLGMAELAAAFGLSHEIGAFIAGITLASSPISEFIAESLKPLRDFFLVIFFFSLGAGFELPVIKDFWLSALLVAIALLFIKPWVFEFLLKDMGQDPARTRETGVRLGQISEFSLLIAVLAASTGVIGSRAAYFIQTIAVISITLSSYYIVRTYPTPIATDDRLRRD